jgi:ubiquinone/menaquinone biosynthesis C-methylase UbiE
MKKVGVFDQYAAVKPMSENVPDLLASFIEVRPGERILDVGCGDGRFLRFCESQMSEGSVYGTDVSYVRLQRCIGEQLKVGQAEVENMPFADNTFQTILLIEVIEHTWQPEKALKELARILAPGGKMILSTPNYPVKRVYDWAAYLRGNSRSPADDPTHFSPFSAKGIAELCSRNFSRVESYMTRIAGESRVSLIRHIHKMPRLTHLLGHKIIVIGYK